MWCLRGMERACNSNENTALHFSNQTGASSDCICHREQEETKGTHGCGLDQLTLAARTHGINRLISSKYLEAVWLLTKSFPHERNPMAFCIYYFNNNKHRPYTGFLKQTLFLSRERHLTENFPQKKQSQQRLTASIKTYLNFISILSCNRYKQVVLYSYRCNPPKISRD